MKYLNRCCRYKYRKRKSNGRKIILSAIIFENGVGELIKTEGQLIDKLIERNENPWKLIKLNCQVAAIVCCLREFEEKIVWELINEKIE